MIDLFSECIFKVFKNEWASFTSIVTEFIFSSIIIVCGILINYSFLAKLKQEKRSKPAGRKGNVVEPIMTVCCWVQMIFWPTRLVMAWLFHNEILNAEIMPTWIRYFMLNVLMIGRVYLCFYSFFCAFIRYVYIVHYEKVYHIEFQMVANRVKIASIFVPVFVGTLSLTVVGGYQLKGNDIFDQCSDSITEQGEGNARLSILATMFPDYLTPFVVRLIYYLTVLVWMIFGLNTVEAFMYRSIFAQIRRYRNNFYDLVSFKS